MKQLYDNFVDKTWYIRLLCTWNRLCYSFCYTY